MGKKSGGSVGRILAFILLLLAACSGSSPAPTPPPSTAPQTGGTQVTGAAPAQPTTAAPSPAPSATVVPPGDFVNPVINSDFPDPDVLQVGNIYYAYATNGAGKNIQLARSPDLVHWDLLPDAMPALPSWAQLGGSFVWAPEVIAIGNQFALYFTARDAQSDKQCVGVATSAKPEGKFKSTGDHPLVCQPDLGGDIDPSPFRDGNKLYLYWKNDGNCCGITTWLWVQELAPDGLTLVGQPAKLIENDQPWEGRIIEAPTMVKHDNRYYLFFSGNLYSTVDYAVGYADCQSATGPCKQAEVNPILKSKLGSEPLVIGPGGEEFVQVGTQTWIIYHAWNEVGGTRGDIRPMWIDRLEWKSEEPVIEGPTTGPQPDPLPEGTAMPEGSPTP